MCRQRRKKVQLATERMMAEARSCLENTTEPLIASHQDVAMAVVLEGDYDSKIERQNQHIAKQTTVRVRALSLSLSLSRARLLDQTHCAWPYVQLIQHLTQQQARQSWLLEALKEEKYAVQQVHLVLSAMQLEAAKFMEHYLHRKQKLEALAALDKINSSSLEHLLLGALKEGTRSLARSFAGSLDDDRDSLTNRAIRLDSRIPRCHLVLGARRGRSHDTRCGSQGRCTKHQAKLAHTQTAGHHRDAGA